MPNYLLYAQLLLLHTESLKRGGVLLFPVPSKIQGRICSLHLIRRVTETVCRNRHSVPCSSHRPSRVRQVSSGTAHIQRLPAIRCLYTVASGTINSQGVNHLPALSLNICPSHSRLKVASISLFLNATYARERLSILSVLMPCDIVIFDHVLLTVYFISWIL